MKASVHRFRVGQTVKIVEGFGYARSPNMMFTIVALLPSNGAHYQYKIRNSGEVFDRTAQENELTIVNLQ